MHLQYLALTNFRNYRHLEAAFPPGAVILCGRNGQGKTSLLEAVHYLTAAHSPQAATDRQLLHWDAARTDNNPYLKIAAEVAAGGVVRKVEVRLELGQPASAAAEPRLRKTVLLNGAKKRVSDLAGVVNAVLFLPQDMALIEGGPGGRRNYLDATLCQVDATYAAELAGYTRVLAQRNALLKALQDRRTNGSAQLEFWDGQLCAHGAQLLARRTLAIAELAAHAGPLHRELAGGRALLQLDYRPSFTAGQPANAQAQPDLFAGPAPTAPGVAEIAAGMQVRLRALRAEETARGSTLIGPHRDELRFLENGVDLGLYGSRGQGRTAVLALKLAQMAWMQTRTGEWPILLLDEVLAELDPQRRAQLLRRVTGAEQLLLTTADPDLFDAPFRARAQIWEVAAGILQQRP